MQVGGSFEEIAMIKTVFGAAFVEPQDGAVTVVAASSSPSPAIENGISACDDCAVVYAQLISSDYELTAVTTGSAEDGGALRLYTDYLFVGTVPYQ